MEKGYMEKNCECGLDGVGPSQRGWLEQVHRSSGLGLVDGFTMVSPRLQVIHLSPPWDLILSLLTFSMGKPGKQLKKALLS